MENEGGRNSQATMNWILFGLSLFGLILAIVGYLLDHVVHFPWLMRILASEYVKGSRALDHLAEHEHNAISAQHPGFPTLWEKWPISNVEKESVAFVGRGPAYMNLLHNVTNDIQLFLVDEHRNAIGQFWLYSEARAALSEEMNRRIFRIGTTTFFAGVTVSLAAALASLISSFARPNGQPNQSKQLTNLSDQHPIDPELGEFIFSLFLHFCQ
jgi:hypothetical protein